MYSCNYTPNTNFTSQDIIKHTECLLEELLRMFPDDKSATEWFEGALIADTAYLCCKVCGYASLLI